VEPPLRHEDIQHGTRPPQRVNGRLGILGIGAAWNDVEHEGYGYDFPRA
jgi:hypothetical protein